MIKQIECVDELSEINLSSKIAKVASSMQQKGYSVEVQYNPVPEINSDEDGINTFIHYTALILGKVADKN
jgi:hypothetical protein